MYRGRLQRRDADHLHAGRRAGDPRVGVADDLRCPADAICITGGNAIVHVAVVSGGTEAGYELHTGTMLPVRHGDVTIALVDLQPYPFSAWPIDPGDYRATLRITR